MYSGGVTWDGMHFGREKEKEEIDPSIKDFFHFAFFGHKG